MLYVVMYKQYNKWSFTVPFERYSEMRHHIEMYLDRPEKDYITEIRIFEMTPEWLASTEQWKKQH